MGPSNQYEAAITQVGSIIEDYDSDKMFPVYGFGGLTGHMTVKDTSHFFPVTGNESQPEVQGVQGILQAYRGTLPMIQLSGPTYFGGVLNGFKNHVMKTAGQPVYHVLLLLTDGTIHDMKSAKQFIVDLSAMPCSVIIIGVGTADFTAMRELDGDGPGTLRDCNGR